MEPKIDDTYDDVKEIDTINTKRTIDPSTIDAYIKTYNLIGQRVNDKEVVPELAKEVIISEWISIRNWMMIPPKDCTTKDQAMKSPYPNIWFSIYNDMKEMNCGLHWAQSPSVNNFLNLLDSLNSSYRDKLQKVFSQFKNDYDITTEKKFLKKGMNPSAPAEFITVDKWKLSDFGDNVVKELLISIEKIRIEGKNMRLMNEVEWCVPTIEIAGKSMNANDYETLISHIQDFIAIQRITHETLTVTQLNKIRRNLEKEFDYDGIKKRYDQLILLYNLKKLTSELFSMKVEEINVEITNYNLAFNKNYPLLEVKVPE